MIRLDEVSLKYDDKVILKEINIEIKEPGIYVLGGESGSGKSSLLNILSLMETRYEGEYYLDEENVSSFNDEERTKARFELITYLFQIPKLIESETIKVNIEIALGRKISKKEELSYLKKIHMNPSKKRISSLSGGEKQRVNILSVQSAA